MSIGNIQKQPPQKVEQTRLYALLAGRLYKTQKNKILRLCIKLDDQYYYLQYAHIAVGNVHFSKEQTMQWLKHFGVFWPKMQEDVHKWVSSCKRCRQSPPLPYATLFQVQLNPRWGQHIVIYLQNRHFSKTTNKQRRKAIEIEALDFTNNHWQPTVQKRTKSPITAMRQWKGVFANFG